MRKFGCFFLLTISSWLTAGAQPFSLVRDITPGTGSGNPGNIITMGESVFFRANDGIHGDELWKSDGTEVGTIMVKDINSGSANSSPAELININGIIFFHVNDGIHGDELWKSNGTAAGTVIVKDINPGPLNSIASRLIKINNTLFFAATDGTHGLELWKTDGTETGTVMVKDMYAGTGSGNPQSFVNLGNTLFFSAADGVHAGYDIWKTDGTEAGTVMIKDIYPGSAAAIVESLTAVNNTIFFTAGGYPSSTLWKTDGTEAGTEIVKGFIFPVGLTNVNGVLFFQGRSTTQETELWKSDGTDAGTVLVKDIRTGAGSSNPQNFINVEGIIYFRADDGSGYKLWKTDGSASGTIKVKDIDPVNMTNVRGTLYFSAWKGTGLLTDKEIWKSDGSDAGTVIVQSIAQTGGSSPADFTLAGLKLFASASDNINGRELWMADLSRPAGGLPLTMVDFKGQLVGNNGVLKWKTVAEHNTSHFEIERSPDGRFFTKAATIAAAGNSTIERQYAYTDTNIILLGAPAEYYRLKMKDLDGKFVYSKIIAINISKKEGIVMLYSNPVHDNAVIIISVIKKENITCSIIDQHGRLVQRKSIAVNEGSNSISLETNSLAAGVYTIVVNGTYTSRTIRFVKQ